MKVQEVQKPFNVSEGANLLIGINPCGEPSVDYNSDMEVESDGHQTGIAVSGSPVTASGHGPPGVHNSFGPATTTSRNTSGPLASRDTLAQISSAHALLDLITGNQACAVVSPHGIGYYHCTTQQRADGAARAQIGIYGYITRWLGRATVAYVILEESFEKPEHARFTAARVAEATATWKGVGVEFERVPRNHLAPFQIRYLDLPFDNRRDTYAEAFFPQDGPGTLFVYKLALQAANIHYLANILAHEFGHILGLRHNFAGDICKETRMTKEPGSVLLGTRNESSAMNYFTDPKHYSVQEQDIGELRSFYDFTGERYKGLMICDFVPGKFLFASVE
ncbi:hypothetical protein GGR58DRAFT_508226 [Xylaria digitata]|nr:hypothetical protein GGR58DRAFT_508226 [Xylaria digitata]